MRLEEGQRHLHDQGLQHAVVVGDGPHPVLFRHLRRPAPAHLHPIVAAHVTDVGEHGLGGGGEVDGVPAALVLEPGHVEGGVQPRQVRHHGGPALDAVGVGEEVGGGGGAGAGAGGRDVAVLALLEDDPTALDLGVALHQAVGQGQVGHVHVQVPGAPLVQEQAVEHVGQLHAFVHLFKHRWD